MAHFEGVVRVQAEDADGGVVAADGEEAVALAPLRDGPHIQAGHVARHVLLLALHQLALRVHYDVGYASAIVVVFFALIVALAGCCSVCARPTHWNETGGEA